MFKNGREWERTENYGMKEQRSYYIPFDRKDKKSRFTNGLVAV